MKLVTDYLNVHIKNWWTSLLLGLVYIGIALVLFFIPIASYIMLSAVFSIAILISGLLELLFAVSNRHNMHSWGWYLVGGIFDIIIGFYLAFYPLVSMELLPFVVAFWLLFRGFTLCGYATDMKHYGTRDWGWYLCYGILAVLCSIVILWQPGFGVMYILYLLAAALMTMGLFRILMAFELKRIRDYSIHKAK